MPQDRHHKRHHTWPQCGSELCMCQSYSLDIHVSKSAAGPAHYIAPYFQAAAARQDELLYDDTGIPELARQSKRAARLGFRSNRVRAGTDPIILSGSTVRTRGVLRRLTRRPPMAKSRSMVIVPSTMASGGKYVATGWVMSQGLKPDFVVGSGEDRLAGEAVGAARVVSEGRHRRRHSEQPRVELDGEGT
ncbi:hypothetical protein N7535_001678 [Penicillium sp. DV-2018c]|nr:hypothetical protein N7461_005082 [Penicillium sp. DV-2018c]KAJ5583058.1 hypothetical protein N7535_001678 [Penicillium sp. DV-2018c]